MVSVFITRWEISRKYRPIPRKSLQPPGPGEPSITHWRVIWAQTANGHGVTEGGSSGSPLFDNTGHIIGNLTGGESSCDTANLDKPDYFGKFSYSWSSCGPDSTWQLSYWLDPDSTGELVLEGVQVAVQETSPGKLHTSVYPNPSTGMINISLESARPSGMAELALIDIRGSLLIKESRKFTGTEQLDISSFCRVSIFSGSAQDLRFPILKSLKYSQS